MAKGAVAKQAVINRIAEAFGTDFIGEVDKKVYVWATENGERVQIAMALTCPKTPIETADAGGGDWNFEDAPAAPGIVATPTKTAAEISEAEKKNIADLMSRLGL